MPFMFRTEALLCAVFSIYRSTVGNHFKEVPNANCPLGPRNYGMDTESLKFMFISKRIVSLYKRSYQVMTVFALAVMEYAVGVSKFGKNPMTL